MTSYHLTKKGDKWQVMEQGMTRVLVSAGTKKEAVKQAQTFMNKNHGSLKIHKENGQIQEERTYPRSADPRKSKG